MDNFRMRSLQLLGDVSVCISGNRLRAAMVRSSVVFIQSDNRVRGHASAQQLGTKPYEGFSKWLNDNIT